VREKEQWGWARKKEKGVKASGLRREEGKEGETITEAENTGTRRDHEERAEVGQGGDSQAFDKGRELYILAFNFSK
jgi:hypothetical protein